MPNPSSKLILKPEDIPRFMGDYPHKTNRQMEELYPYITYQQFSYLAKRYNLSKSKPTPSISARKTLFTKWEEDFIRMNFHRMTNKQLAKALGKTLTVVRTYCYKMGLKRMKLEYWTDEQVQFLKENYTKMGDVEMAELFDQVYNKEKGWTKKHIEKKRRYLKLKRSKSVLKAIHQRNVYAGRYSINHWKRWADKITPVGEIRVWQSKEDRPYLVIKTAEGFVHYPRWLWTQHHGEPPEGMLVRVIGSTTNKEMTVADLELLTREENASRTTHDLSNRYVAGILTHNNPDLRKEILDNYPEIIEIKRQSILLNRQTNEHQATIKHAH